MQGVSGNQPRTSTCIGGVNDDVTARTKFLHALQAQLPETRLLMPSGNENRLLSHVTAPTSERADVGLCGLRIFC